MKTTYIKNSQLIGKNNSQREIREIEFEIKKFKDKKHIIHYIEKDPSKLSCPNCSSKEKYKWGYRSELRRYKCKKCKRTYNSLTGTPLARLRQKDKWGDYMDCLFKSKTIRVAANHCKTANTTSFRWRHRFLEIIKHQNKDKQTGIVEFSEKIMRTNFKGCRNIIKEKEKYDLRKLIMVLFSKDRASKIQDQIFTKLGIKSISDTLDLKLDKDILLCTEDKELYKQISGNHRLRHGFINLKNGEKIKKDIVHLNNINKYKNDFVNWLEIFMGVATKYLVNYIAWHRFFDTNNHNYRLKSYFASL